MKNTKQNYIAPSFKSMNVAIRKSICDMSPTIEELVYEELGDMDD